MLYLLLTRGWTIIYIKRRSSRIGEYDQGTTRAPNAPSVTSLQLESSGSTNGRTIQRRGGFPTSTFRRTASITWTTASPGRDCAHADRPLVFSAHRGSSSIARLWHLPGRAIDARPSNARIENLMNDFTHAAAPMQRDLPSWRPRSRPLTLRACARNSSHHARAGGHCMER